MSRAATLKNLFLTLLGALGLGIFSGGFFPSKIIAPGDGEFLSEHAFANHLGSPQFEKLIFIVVDALRSDFMYSRESNMAFLHSLIREGSAIPFTAYSNPPTVTLPRLKGITTGQIPSFVDAVLNIADDKDQSQGLTFTDSWVKQFLNQEGGRKINFFGDDTWLKLFPADIFFHESEGTSSFFVNDFVEVDRNVSRHIKAQLLNDFDALILHYLGLDHIGHSGGPKSKHMAVKQKEMDQILQQIYSSEVGGASSTLVVLMGDHGMNEIGNHGGSSPGETSPGLAFISSRFLSCVNNESTSLESPIERNDFNFYSSVDQVDLVPTLAALFNIPIPKNSVGVIIPQLLHLWHGDFAKKKVLLENCEQLYALFETQRLSGSSELLLDLESLRVLHNHSISHYYEFLYRIKRTLVLNATNYSLTRMYMGFFVAISTSVVTLYSYCGAFIRSGLKSSKFITLYLMIVLSYACLFHASSFIEEEHQFWWFFAISFFGCFIAQYPSRWKSVLCSYICLRLLRSWSSLGQKDRSPSHLSGFILQTGGIVWTLVLVSCFGPPLAFMRFANLASFRIWLATLLEILMCSCTIILKVLQLTIEGKAIPPFVTTIIAPLLDLSQSLDALQSLAIDCSRIFYGLFFVVFTLKLTERHKMRKFSMNLLVVNIFIHQSRVEIIPMYLVFWILECNIKRMLDDSISDYSICLSLVTLILQNLSFFSAGNSNSIATIDLANAYNGLRSYDLPVVGLLTFISNFGPTLYWGLAYYRLLHCKALSSEASRKYLLDRSSLISIFYLISSASLILSCIAQRYHLFIWSVFCPKVLYFAAWLILVHIGFDCIFCQTCLPP